MIWLRRILTTLAVVAVAVLVGVWVYGRRSLPRTAGDVVVAGLDGPIDIVRDGWGVPHVFATTDHDAYL
ncbi:MAG: hypothetical protein U0470_14615, partial [Anaerolineae bacterium]